MRKAQFVNQIQPDRRLLPEERLWHAVIKQAVKDVREVMLVEDAREKERLQGDAFNFLFNTRDNRLDFICQALGINSYTIRPKLIKRV